MRGGVPNKIPLLA